MSDRSDVIVSVRGVAKQYRLRRVGTYGYGTLRDSLRHAVAHFLRRGPSGPAGDDAVWALRDISFTLRRGEIVGLVGPNGSGKSTLLKILSRITEPTSGAIDLYGRVGSLLEVGTGFHPELSGRENVLLNAAILGMTRREAKDSFASIVEFSDLSRFIDVPVKFYSSGMYLRLAFAVAVHFRPEILLVDEVLAVGDAEFQRKCLKRMQEVGAGGRTIILVSHNLAAIRQVCARALAVENGRLVGDGPVDQVIDDYQGRVTLDSESTPVESQLFFVEKIAVCPIQGQVLHTFGPARIAVRLRARASVTEPGAYFGILSSDGDRVAGLDLRDFVAPPALRKGDTLELEVDIVDLPLMPGAYRLEVHLKDAAARVVEPLQAQFPFEIADSPVYGSRRIDHWFGRVGLRPTVRISVGSGS